MKRLLVLALAMALVMVGSVMPVTEQTTSASVTVNTLISITISTCGAVDFGSKDPGTTDNPISCQGAGIAAVNVTNDAVSNVNVDVQVKGTDFSGGPIAVSNVEFDEDNTKTTPTTLSTIYQTSTSGVVPGSNAGVWYWLDIPGGTTAGTYSSTFSFQGI